MSPDVTSSSKEEMLLGSEENQIATQGDGQVAPSGIDSVGGSFFNTKNISPDEKEIVSFDHIQNSLTYLRREMRTEVFDAVINQVGPWYKRSDLLLPEFILNDHSLEDHIGPVVITASQIASEFPDKINELQKEAALFAGLGHDVALFHATKSCAERMLDQVKKEDPQNDELISSLESLLKGLELLKLDDFDGAREQWKQVPVPQYPIIGKRELDSHTHHGMTLLHEWITEGPLASAVQYWTPEQHRIAELTVLHHSNGSEYDPEKIEVPVKFIRTADKLHNLFTRSEHLINERSVHHPMKMHQFVNVAIRSMSVSINHKLKQLIVDYDVKPSVVSSMVQPHLLENESFDYTKESFLGDADKAYGGSSFKYAAEGVSSMFAEEGETHNPDSQLVVRYNFDDETVERSYAYNE